MKGPAFAAPVFFHVFAAVLQFFFLCPALNILLFCVFTVGLQTICEKQENLFIYILTKSVTNFIIYMFMLVFSNPLL